MNAAIIPVLMDPNYAGFVRELPDVEAAGRAVGRQIVVVNAANENEFETAFVRIGQRVRARFWSAVVHFLLAGGAHWSGLAARQAIPAIYDVREFVEAGGLISYAASISGAYRQAGIYVGRILKGAKPAELPVLQPTKFELVINLKTAKALGLEVPPPLLARADEVIE